MSITPSHQQVSDGSTYGNMPATTETMPTEMVKTSPPPPIVYCIRCNGSFAEYENMACTGEHEYWHLDCFVCAQCFRPFGPDLEHFDYNGRKYCEQDFRTLFAPCCSKCNHYIIGRFIRALNKCWHPNCFLCEKCSRPLADQGFIRSNGRALCHCCNVLEKAVQKNRHPCYKCKAFIEEEDLHDGQVFRYKDETYHAYHFNCHTCGIELRPDACQVNGDLYCLKCHDQLDIPICGACRRPVEERVVTALGKHWHKEHFVCAACERPFLGRRHWEVKGAAYCEHDYYQLFGPKCSACSQAIRGNVLCALDKYYCADHFACGFCRKQLVANKSKFLDVEGQPCCKKCYKRLPARTRRQLAEIKTNKLKQEKAEAAAVEAEAKRLSRRKKSSG